jgi:hypothetical protein
MEVKKDSSDILGTWVTELDSITFDDNEFLEPIEDADGSLTLQFHTGANYSFIPVENFEKFE